MKEETPLKQIAAEVAKVSKNKEIVLHKPKSLKNVLKETSLQDVFPKEIAVSSQTATQKSSQYFPNKYFEKFLVMEEEFSEKPPQILVKELFNGWHFKPLDSQKPQQYYENILVQTGSIPKKNTKNSCLKCLAHWTPNLKMNLQHPQSRR
ncbi:hypothetical protein Gotur_019339 [Gossypium turneri]